MKYKFLLGALVLGCSFSVFADGYTDGIDYYKAGQYGNARTILNRTINDPGTNKSLAYYYLGQLEILYKNYPAAKDYFDKGIQADAQSPYNYVGLGNYYLRTGNVKEAEHYFKEASKLGKKNYEIPVEIARAYYFNDPENPKNMEIVRKYIDKARKDSKNTEPSIYILEGDILFNQGDHLGDAATQYEMAISYDNDNPEGYVKYSKAYMGVNPMYGIQKLEELLSRQPNSALAQRELAERYYETNEWHKAVKQYGEYMKNPNHFPEDKARYSFLLYVYQDYDNALRVADEILAEDPTDFQAQRIKMLSEYGLKNYEAAEKTAQKFLANPDSKNPFTLTDYNTYGAILSALKKYPEAVAAYEKALALDPQNPTTLTSLAYAYSDADYNQLAAETLQKAIECTPEPTLTQYLRASGMWLYAGGDTDDPAVKVADANKGLEDIDIVIARAEPSVDFYRRRAMLLSVRDLGEVTNDVGQAYEVLLNALDADPANIDPANGKTKWYLDAFRILNRHYENIGAKDKQDVIVQRYNDLESQLNN